MVLTSRVCSAYCKKPELRKLLVLKTRNISKFKSETFNKRLAPSSPLSDSCQSGLEQTLATLDKPVDLPACRPAYPFWVLGRVDWSVAAVEGGAVDLNPP